MFVVRVMWIHLVIKLLSNGYRTLRETGSLLPKTGKFAKVSVNEETIERVRMAFARSPRKSIRRASTELQIPRSTIHKIIHKRLHLCAFKIQLRHHIKPNDRPLRAHFAVEMLLRIKNDNSYLDNIVFLDEATFHLCGKINKHNCQIWGSANLHVIHEHERDMPKVNVWCGLTRNSVIGPFFFTEATVTGHGVSGHVTELCYWPTSPRIDFPARWGTAPLSLIGAWLRECKFSQYVDQKRSSLNVHGATCISYSPNHKMSLVFEVKHL